MATLLTESGSAPVKSGNNWRAVLITPGKGSSGIYTEEMLKTYGPQAFKKGTHSYVDHPRSEEEVRSPKNLIGVLAEDARYEKGVGLVAELNIMPHWKEFVEAVAPHTGLSIYAMGEGNYNDDGEVVVENLIPHTQNSVDLVSYPGRPGSKLADKLYEQAISMVAEAMVEEKDLVKWTEGGETYYGQVSYVMTEGVFPFEGDPLSIRATESDPVAVVRIWDDENGEWVATEELRAAKTADLTKVSALGEAYDNKPKDAYSSKEAAERRASELGCSGTHSMEMDGQTMYMPCSTHSAYEKATEASAPMGGKEGTAANSAAATMTKMKEEYMELKELSDQIAELPNLVAAAVAEALAPAVETEEKEEIDIAAVAEAMVEADLPEVSRKAVYESLRAGGDLAEAIESQKVFVESVKEHFKEEAKAASKPVEESVIVTTEEKAPRLSEILNVKVGA